MNNRWLPIRVLTVLPVIMLLISLARAQDNYARWEFNFGVGVGVTGSTDHLIIKCILGRRFSWRHDHAAKLKTSTAQN